MIKAKTRISKEVLVKAFRLMATAKAMAEIYEENFKFVSKYVHATSRGHEAIQLAVGMQLLPQDFLAPYYRDDAMLLSIGMRPYELMLQLMAKRDDPFSGGRTYYAHPSLRDPDKPKIPHQSSATGMQAIPTTGVAMGLQYKEKMALAENGADKKPVAVCSLGDASVTEGEVAEAFQMAALKQLPIIYVVQDNGWDISANAEETRAQDADEYARGFHGLDVRNIDGSDFYECFLTMQEVIRIVRKERRPFLVHAKVPLLNHHTSGVRKEWYRDDLEEHRQRDPYPVLRGQLLDDEALTEEELGQIEEEVRQVVKQDFEAARAAEDPRPEDLFSHDFAPTPITEEKGEREPAGGEPHVMVDSALFAVEELMRRHKECLLYGQDVGGRLGGVFREAATLAKKFGDERVFNTPIQEAFIIGSTVGMSAAGLKPIVEVQFADYIWPGLNQLFTEVSRSCYLSNGKWPVSCVIRVPIGAYGSGGPYHSSSVESVLANIRGIKIAYPSTGADLKGLIKSAFYDPNPVVILEHKGLYWSKVKGTEAARTILPDEDYVIPFGKARVALEASPEAVEEGQSMVVVTYGMGVHWALNAAREYPGRVEILDLRTLYPLDEAAVYEAARRHGRALVVTEEPVNSTFAQSVAARIQENCFEHLDAPVRTIGSENMPAIPLNEVLEKTMIPSIEKVGQAIANLLKY
ncbi:MAG: tungsten formylmethanofuran dehydrogenase [Phaeodactylibacter sp.]|nr:tungsten formylmethanofuran dehydrogenase [Phaeodactylibacter sp.]